MSSRWYDNFCFFKPKKGNEIFSPLLRKIDILHETCCSLDAVEYLLEVIDRDRDRAIDHGKWLFNFFAPLPFI